MSGSSACPNLAWYIMNEIVFAGININSVVIILVIGQKWWWVIEATCVCEESCIVNCLYTLNVS